MSLGHNPKIVKDGLVLALDAANKKSSLRAIEALIVAGGGAGGGGIGGGGGGGGVIHMPVALIIPGTAYTITVGAGGASAVYPTSSSNGGNSSAFGATAAGGGGSGVHDTGVGLAGGSGGGAASNNGVLNQGGASSGNSLGTNAGFIYGNRGGNMLNSRTGGPTAAAGGGGAGTIAADVNSNIVLSIPGTAQGRGGNGIPNNILNTLYYWGGGGGGGAYFNGYAGDGGLGGGGGGSCSGGAGPTTGGATALNSGVGAAVNANGGNGGANTGGGGGGGAWQTTSGGNGGSGIVVVRYKGSQRATGGTVTFVNGHTIHTFTTSGIFTPNGTPGTGTIWSDSSKNGNSGTLINGIGYNSSSSGSFVFDGVDDYVSIPHTLTTPFTVTGFVRYVDQAKTANTFFNTSPHNVLAISLNRSGGGELVVYIGNGSSWLAVPGITSSQNMLVNQWYQIAFTSNGSGSILYLNGTNVGTSIYSPSGWGSTYYLGSIIIATGEYLKGNISQTTIYNRALTATEIKQNFNALKGRFGL